MECGSITNLYASVVSHAAAFVFGATSAHRNPLIRVSQGELRAIGVEQRVLTWFSKGLRQKNDKIAQSHMTVISSNCPKQRVHGEEQMQPNLVEG